MNTHLQLRGMAIMLAAGIVVHCRAADSFETSGYVKNMFSAIDLRNAAWIPEWDGGSVLMDDYFRARLKVRAKPENWLTLDVDYEVYGLWGDTVEFLEQAGSASVGSGRPGFAGSGGRPRFMDMESNIVEERRFRLSHGIDRLRLRLESGSMELSLGRQPVSWGSGMFWTPTDMFGSFAPTEIDRDEKSGLDVIRLTFSRPDGAALDVVVEPLDVDSPGAADTADSAAGLRASAHVGEYDVSACGGYVAGDWLAGGDFRGYLGNAGFHGEALYSWVQETDGRNNLKLALGLDYSFNVRWQPYVLVEYYHNGAGSGDGAGYASVLAEPSVQRGLIRGTTYNVGRNYLGASVTLTLTPLVRCQNQTIVNLGDGSASEYVSLSWSVGDNSDLTAGVLGSAGPAGTEFGGWLPGDGGGPEMRNPHMYFAYWKLYF